MAFSSVDCAFDLDYFEFSLTYVADGPMVCLFLVNPPVGYNESIVFREVTNKIFYLRTGGFHIFIKEPARFSRIDCGVSGVLCGVLTHSEKSYGIISSFHYDFLGEMTNVLSITLPLVLSSLVVLFSGGIDSSKNSVERVDDVFILGGLSCRNYPVAEDYVWPDLEHFTPAIFPVRLYGSRMCRVSCNYLPVVYDWSQSDLYLPVDCDPEPTVIRKKLNDFLFQLNNDAVFFEKRIVNERIVNDTIGLNDIFDFMKAPYDVSLYRRWKDFTVYRDAQASPSDFYFNATWIQHLSIRQPDLLALDQCIHRVAGRRFRHLDFLGEKIKRPRRCQEVLDFYLHQALAPRFDTTPEPSCRLPKLPEDLLDFDSLFERFSDVLNSSHSCKAYFVGAFAVIRKRLDDHLLRSGHACRMILTSDVESLKDHGCLFDISHDIDFLLVTANNSDQALNSSSNAFRCSLIDEKSEAKNKQLV